MFTLPGPKCLALLVVRLARAVAPAWPSEHTRKSKRHCSSAGAVRPPQLAAVQRLERQERSGRSGAAVAAVAVRQCCELVDPVREGQLNFKIADFCQVLFYRSRLAGRAGVVVA